LRNYLYGFIYKSEDYGINWSRINSIKEMPFYCLEVSDSNLIATGGIFGSFYTSNFGNSWDTLNTDFTNKSIQKLWATDKYLFAYSSEGGFLSTNKGISWNKINTGSSSSYYCAFTFYHDRIFVVAFNVIYYSSDNGLSWIRKELPVNLNQNFPVTDFAFNDNIIFAGGGFSLYVSTDFGESWQKSQGVPNIRNLAINGEYLFAAAIDGFSARAKIIDLLPPVGVDEKNPSHSKVLSITPNPCSNQIKIRLNDDISRFSKGKVEVSSNFGEMLFNITIDEGIYSQGFDLDVSAYPSGMYFCTVRTGSFIETQPFLVIH